MKNPVRDIIEGYVENEYPADVDREFRSWLTDGSHDAEKDRELSRLWESAVSDTVPDLEQSMERMRRFTGIADRRTLSRLRLRLRLYNSAAVVALLVAVAAAVLIPRSQQPAMQPDLLQAYIPKAEKSTITLPDGTVAMLNANSTLLYPPAFAGAERCVYLTGEASFKVSRDAERPFIVKTSDFQVTALGTEFNVTAYPEEDEITATLISGKVRVDYDNLSHSEILTPSRQLVYNRRTRSAATARADISDVTAWQRGETVMRGLTPDEIFTCLARKYPYTFVYSPHSLKSDRYTLTFAADASLPEVMGIISKVMGDIRFRIEADRCYIDPVETAARR